MRRQPIHFSNWSIRFTELYDYRASLDLFTRLSEFQCFLKAFLGSEYVFIACQRCKARGDKKTQLRQVAGCRPFQGHTPPGVNFPQMSLRAFHTNHVSWTTQLLPNRQQLLRLPQELFVIGHLNDQGHVKGLLQPPWQRLRVPADSNLIPHTRVSLKLPTALWRTRSHKASPCFTPKLDCCLVWSEVVTSNVS